MKLKIMAADNSSKGDKALPNQFEKEIRVDLIRRAVLAIQANKRQRYGADPKAGMKTSAELSRRRRKYRGSYGIGISRVPRKIMSRQGTRLNWTAAFAPGTVGGRRSHPPKSEKIWEQKINDKERRLAIMSAMSATINPELTKARGHKVPDTYPFILDSSAEDINKTKDVVKALVTLGFKDELERTSEKKIRAGRGKTRGRKYKSKVGPLFVVSKDCKLAKAARNIPGVEVIFVDKLNAETLAPGAEPGRLTLYTDASIDKLANDKLFM